MGDRPSRRRFLRIAAATTAGVALAGCSGGSDGGDSTDGGDGGDGGGGDGNDAGGGDGGDTGGGGSEFTETDTIEMNDQLAYAPKKVRVSQGTTVTWENVGAIGHTVTAYEDEIPDGATYFASGGFDSQSAAEDGYGNGEGNVTEGESYSHTFETTGTYEYYCIPHEMNGMVGTIEVV